MKHSILKKFAIGRERAQKERKTKTKTQKSKKVYRIKTLRDSDESTANLTSTASPTAAASSNESPSPRSSLHDESQASVVSELTWILRRSRTFSAATRFDNFDDFFKGKSPSFFL
jgi:hypothetical protein